MFFYGVVLRSIFLLVLFLGFYSVEDKKGNTDVSVVNESLYEQVSGNILMSEYEIREKESSQIL